MSQPVATSQTLDLAQARRQLRAVGRRYAWRRAAGILLPAAAGALLLVLLSRHWPAAQLGFAALAALGLLAIGWLLWPLRHLPGTIAPRLDRQFPALEDSTGLLMQQPENLNLLELLQQQRVARRLGELEAARELSLPVSFRGPLVFTALLLAASAAVWWLPLAKKLVKPAGVAVRYSNSVPTVAGQVPARILETQVRVTPPAYTRQPNFAPTQASFQCPQGSRVRWQVRVNKPSRTAPEVELGRQRLRLQPVAGQPGVYFAEQTLAASTLYRLRFAGTVSDDYAIDVRADLAPIVRIQTPKPYTLVDFGMRPDLPVRATVRDDYGLSHAELVITVAQGQGEAVKFREVRRDLSVGLGTQPTQISLASQLNLPKLGLTYGDELYFYIAARDNAGHSSRTDSYLVQWQDTAVADSQADMGMGIKVAPAYFRSQRQIIIDTDKLIAEKPRLDAATLANRANALGFDQQTLRLRYGKFMGEEVGGSIGPQAPHSPIAEDEGDAPTEHAAPTAEAAEEEHHDHPEPPASSAKASPTAETDALMEPYMHKHDDSETADFLEPAVKAKLRAVLDQMWAAELRLRTGQLAAALPYEYRALRLLKQVQQQTRAFVKKAGFVLQPLPEATLRLTGDLAGAAVPQHQQQLPAPATQPEVRAALLWLAQHSSAASTNPADARVLEQAGAVLSGAALQRPGVYLPALRALRQLVADVRAGRPACAECRPPVERALTDMLAAPPPVPLAAPAPNRLARRYFEELSR
ncbi:DUF4175 domain-containing protein [Hymenobacter sp. BT770]|uniref:DUF4175 domain-containing protein n=1 Tax=Hymenobacter sp. BT770 TaxID=2886942 RepID=UPI001D12E4EE|nr:DUF4175 domain-containing protein [Hymenobacter sp. BT770]MCC3152311.1 DUF4175 domain-containing protein [Hymenobacter sp. BT770]MDO3414124.1 DUF4175 domain-containing protein [Hymenobacter sp. BT770]